MTSPLLSSTDLLRLGYPLASLSGFLQPAPRVLPADDLEQEAVLLALTTIRASCEKDPGAVSMPGGADLPRLTLGLLMHLDLNPYHLVRQLDASTGQTHIQGCPLTDDLTWLHVCATRDGTGVITLHVDLAPPDTLITPSLCSLSLDELPDSAATRRWRELL